MKKGEAQDTAAQSRVKAALRAEEDAAHGRWEDQVVRSTVANVPTGKKAAK